MPIAVRLGAAFGLLALALLAVTLTAVHAFGTFRDDTAELVRPRRARRWRSPASSARTSRLIGREAAEHLYVYDGDLAAQDEHRRRVEAMRQADAQADAAELAQAARRHPELPRGIQTRRVGAWSATVTEALERSRQETVDNVEERDGSRDALHRARSARETRRAVRGRSWSCRTPSQREHGRDRRRRRRRAPARRSKLLLIVMVVALLLAAGFAVADHAQRRRPGARA